MALGVKTLNPAGTLIAVGGEKVGTPQQIEDMVDSVVTLESAVAANAVTIDLAGAADAATLTVRKTLPGTDAGLQKSSGVHITNTDNHVAPAGFVFSNGLRVDMASTRTGGIGALINSGCRMVMSGVADYGYGYRVALSSGTDRYGAFLDVTDPANTADLAVGLKSSVVGGTACHYAYGAYITVAAGAVATNVNGIYCSASGGSGVSPAYSGYFDAGTFRVNGPFQHAGAACGFFNTAPIAKPTGVAVTAEAIHAALVALGLIGV